MTFEAVKDKLHDYIDHADHEKVMAMYTLLYSDTDSKPFYDVETLNGLELTRDNMISGKEMTYTLQQTIANIQNYRSKNRI